MVNPTAMSRVWTWARGARRLGVLVASATMALALVPTLASASGTGPYTSTTSGYDVSYPNCSDKTPSGSTFGIVGMTGGRPFSTNSCVGSEWSQAATLTTTPSAYFNTGYAGAYAKSITSACSSESTAVTGSLFSGLKGHSLSQAEQAWAIGCSEVDYAAAVLSSQTSSTAPLMWWADIETGNSWSLNTTLNQYTIDGISYEMQNTATSSANTAPYPGGIYSYGAAWKKITGTYRWTPTPAPTANWYVSGQTTLTVCAAASFDVGTANNPVPNWLGQTATVNNVDTDYAC